MDVSKPETGTPFGPVKQIEAGVLDNGYVEAGPKGVPVSGLLTSMVSAVLRCPGQRSDRNAARISAAKRSGCSQAAKWPPRSTSLK